MRPHRTLTLAALVCLLLFQPLAAVPRTAPAHPAVYRFTGGLWFDGRGFVPLTMYSVNGLFRTRHQGPVTADYDLSGKYVVPPFAEAHNHHFTEGTDYRASIRTHLSQGIFYAKNTNAAREWDASVRPLLNTPESVDVLFSGGGLTAPGGHPAQIYDFLADRGVFPGWDRARMADHAYFVVRDERELAAKWPLVLAGRPDFVKTYLEHSEEYERRRDDPKFYGQRGLDPRLLPKIVARAHADGLRVAVHVNTAEDFRRALDARADEITHLPLERLTRTDARRAARQKTVVVTTTMSHRPVSQVPDLADVHRHNLRLLREAGARLAVGTDDNSRTALDEALNLRRLGVFDDLALLKLWSESTPQTIFPARKVGLLRDGYEATFLALDANPLEDFSNVRRISTRFKQGHFIK